MRRAPFVVAATGAGLGLLFSYHTRPIKSSVAAAGTTTTTPAAGSTAPGSGSSGSQSESAGTSSPATTATTAPSASRSATGEDVEYRYGDVQLRVTEKGSHITAIDIVSDGSPDPRSQQINSQALPQLQSEAMTAQSADIDGVSGATFTSMAYEQALQSALDQLGS